MPIFWDELQNLQKIGNFSMEVAIIIISVKTLVNSLLIIGVSLVIIAISVDIAIS